jgi:hypothetical protein
MTEQDWLACQEPQEMLELLLERGGTSDRRWRLLACSCCRSAWSLLNKGSRAAVSVAERYADG